MRNSLLVLVLIFGVIAGTAPAKAKKKDALPKLFCQARYVSVQTYEGDPDVRVASQYPSDYKAAIGVQNRIQRWGRYVLVYPPQPGDLVFVVWKERQEGNRLPGQPTEMPPVSFPRQPDPGTRGPGQNPGQPGRPGQPSGPGQNPAGDDGPGSIGIAHGEPEIGAVFPVHDQLAVYLPAGDETMSAPLWKHAEKDGLKEPDMPLFRKLADAVDDACPAVGSN